MNSLFYFHILAFILHSVSTGLSWGHNTDIFKNRNIWYPKFEYKSTNTSVTTTSVPVYIGEKQNYMSWITANEFITALSHLIGFIVIWYQGYFHEIEMFRRTIEYIMTAAILQVALVMGAGDVLFQDVVFIFVIIIE